MAKKILSVWMKILVTTLSFFGVSSCVLWSYQMAYGGPPEDTEKYSRKHYLDGFVTSKNTGKGIPGIKVWLKERMKGDSVDFEYFPVLTSEGGYYEIDLDDLMFVDGKNYILCVEDIDGKTNGQYESYCEEIYISSIYDDIRKNVELSEAE